MRNACTPSIVPGDTDQNIYLVMDDLSRLGRVWREADAEHADLETIIEDLFDGQYHSPVGGIQSARRLVAGWFRGHRPGNPPALRYVRRCHSARKKLLKKITSGYESGLSCRII